MSGSPNPIHSPRHQALVQTFTEKFGELLEEITEQNALVFTGNLDKWIVSTRRTIAFWQDGGKDYRARSMYNPDDVVASAVAIHQIGKPVLLSISPAT